MKTLPATSLRPVYLLPTLFAAGVVIGPVVCALVPALWYAYGAVMAIYFIIDALSVFRLKTPAVNLLAFAGVFLTHITYGIFAAVGLLEKKLSR